MSELYPGDWEMITEQKFEHSETGSIIELAETLVDHGGAGGEYLAVYHDHTSDIEFVIGSGKDEVISDVTRFMEHFPGDEGAGDMDLIEYLA